MVKSSTIIEIDGLRKSFGDKTVLHDISLSIRRGEFVTLLGPSGCGKTTLLRLLAGFLEPDCGTIKLNGSDIAGIPPHHRPMNTVFQRYALFPHLNVYDNIAFGLKLRKVPSKDMDQMVRKALKMVSMTDYEDRDVSSLSGGQQQRVALARAIVNRPQVLLLDEPLAALDLKMRKDMQIELKEMHKNLGITFIYVTHDQEEALTLSDTVVVMNEGHIQQIGTPSDIYNEPNNSFVADFIGESNIFDGIMRDDLKVSFIGKEFDCVDTGFGKEASVDVVIRPEDVYIMSNTDSAQFCGTVTSCTFKGVHYEMFVQTDDGFEIMIQDYSQFEPGQKVGMIIKPSDIHVMRKPCIENMFTGEIVDSTTVAMIGGEFTINETKLAPGTQVQVFVPFDKVELMDDKEDGSAEGTVHFLLYKGNHYHLTIRTTDGDDVFVNTNDIWDKGDMVGVNIAPKDMVIKEL